MAAAAQQTLQCQGLEGARPCHGMNVAMGCVNDPLLMRQLLRRELSPPLPGQLFMAIVLTPLQWYQKASVPITLQALDTRKRYSPGAAEAMMAAQLGPLLCTFEAIYGTPPTNTGASVTPATTSAASTPSGLVPGSGPSGTSNSALDTPAVAGSQGGAAGWSGVVAPLVEVEGYRLMGQRWQRFSLLLGPALQC